MNLCHLIRDDVISLMTRAATAAQLELTRQIEKILCQIQRHNSEEQNRELLNEALDMLQKVSRRSFESVKQSDRTLNPDV